MFSSKTATLTPVCYILYSLCCICNLTPVAMIVFIICHDFMFVLLLLFSLCRDLEMNVRVVELLAIGLLANTHQNHYQNNKVIMRDTIHTAGPPTRPINARNKKSFFHSLWSVQRTVAMGFHHDTITGGTDDTDMS